ncbi:hypothetical protein Pmani_036022 [Petrolisthes manimaculis]|uniref:Uncharacterized protein n=1 Tax=Petrolisthes manimaculis TaxID=1843537 RepID=A0AAE1TPT8_9EUCA|nr:hypothetical protein Pmani_036022 [Petrolisthes manimaculis]
MHGRLVSELVSEWAAHTTPTLTRLPQCDIKHHMLGSPLGRVCSLRVPSSSSYAPWEPENEDEEDDDDDDEGGGAGGGGGGGGGGLKDNLATDGYGVVDNDDDTIHSKLNQLIVVYVALSVLVLMVIKFLSRYSLLGIFLAKLKLCGIPV